MTPALDGPLESLSGSFVPVMDALSALIREAIPVDEVRKNIARTIAPAPVLASAIPRAMGIGIQAQGVRILSTSFTRGGADRSACGRRTLQVSRSGTDGQRCAIFLV